MKTPSEKCPVCGDDNTMLLKCSEDPELIVRSVMWCCGCHSIIDAEVPEEIHQTPLLNMLIVNEANYRTMNRDDEILRKNKMISSEIIEEMSLIAVVQREIIKMIEGI